MLHTPLNSSTQKARQKKTTPLLYSKTHPSAPDFQQAFRSATAASIDLRARLWRVVAHRPTLPRAMPQRRPSGVRKETQATWHRHQLGVGKDSTKLLHFILRIWNGATLHISLRGGSYVFHP